MLDYNPQCWQDVEALMDAGLDRLILNGPPGTGKTYAGLTAGRVDAGAYRLECTENMTDFEIVGGFLPAQDGFTYKEGSAIKAWDGDGVMGGRLVIDEIDKAAGDILALLLAMTDSMESASWRHPVSGKVMKPREHFSVVMTTNALDMDILEPALKDRFPVSVFIDKPHPTAIAALPGKYQRVAIATVGEISLRSWMQIAKLEKSLGQSEALRLVVGGERARQLADDLAIDEVA